MGVDNYSNDVINISRNKKIYAILYSIIISFGLFISGFDGSLFFFGSYFILKTVNINYFYLGISTFSYALGIAIFSFVGGYLFDKYNIKNAFILSVIILSLFSSLTGFITNTYEFLFYRFMTGVGIGLVQPLICSFVGNLLPDYRARMLSIPNILFGLAGFLSPFIFSYFDGFKNFKYPFLISGILGIFLIILVLLFIPEMYSKKQKHNKNFIKSLNWNGKLLLLSELIASIGSFAVASYYIDYLSSYLLFNNNEIILIGSISGLGVIFGVIPGAYLGDYYGRKISLIISSIFGIIAGSITFLIRMDFNEALISNFIAGFGAGVSYTNFIAMIQENIDFSWSGSLTGSVYGFMNIGAMLGGPLFAYILYKSNFIISGIILGIIPSYIILIIFMFTNDNKFSIIKNNIYNKIKKLFYR